MSRIRVLQLITRLVPRGAPRHVLDLAAGLDPARWEVEIAAGEGETGEGSLWDEARGLGLPVAYLPDLRRPVRPVTDARAYRALRRLLERGRYDIVHTHISKAGVLGRLAARRAGVPRVVHTYHGRVSELEQPTAVGRLCLWAERRAARHTDALIAVSESTRDHLLRMGVGTAAQYRVVPNGIDLAHYAPDRAFASPDAVVGQPVIGTVGSLTEEKGTDLLIRAAQALRAEFPNLQVCVVGSGKRLERLGSLAGELGLAGHIHLAGAVPDVRPWLAAFDVFVLPSHSEGMSRALLEAMAMRRPVVATRVGAVPEKLAREGAVVEPGDLEGLTHALGAVLRSHAKQGRLAELGYGAATEFGLDHMVNSVAEVYEALGPRG